MICSLKNKLTDWRAKELWSVLDRRATQKEYCGQAACKKLNVLVIGAGIFHFVIILSPYLPLRYFLFDLLSTDFI